jgi:hypothetical protein
LLLLKACYLQVGGDAHVGVGIAFTLQCLLHRSPLVGLEPPATRLLGRVELMSTCHARREVTVGVGVDSNSPQQSVSLER